MIKNIDFVDLKRPSIRILLSVCCSVVAWDFESNGEVVLLNEPFPGGTIVRVCLDEHHTAFEGPQLRSLVEIVKELRGRCCFDLADCAASAKDPFSSEPTNRISDSLTCEDDEDSADWWKGGLE